MKNILRFSILVFALTLFSFPSSALTLPSLNPDPAKKESATATLPTMNIQDFVTLTPRKYKEITGEKMTIPQKISLKIAQHRLKRELKANPQSELRMMSGGVDTSDFNIGGFILGLLLSVVGVLIAYIMDDSNVIKWAWVGFGISLLIILLVLII
ncbi:MAG: hypothetical protein ABI415_10735 [Flavitalea sp.]